MKQTLQKIQNHSKGHPSGDTRGQVLSRLLRIAVSRLDGAPATVSRVCWAFANLKMQFSEAEFLSIQEWIFRSGRDMEDVDIAYLFTGYVKLWLFHGMAVEL